MKEEKSTCIQVKSLEKLNGSQPVAIKNELNREIPEQDIGTVTSNTSFKIKTEVEQVESREETAFNSCSLNVEVKTEVKMEPTAKRPLFNATGSGLASKRPLFGVPGGGTGSKRPSQTRDPNDPWFAVYEAKRQEALNNMKQGDK